MRRLIARLPDGDDGAVAITVALVMIVVLGFAAITIDVGAAQAERNQLQNGADAAALAVGQQSACAAPASSADTTTAQGLARSSVAVDPVKHQVTVSTWAVDASGASGRRNWFAPALGSGLTHTEIGASATVACVHPLYGTAVLPLTFHDCNFINPDAPGATTPRLIRYDQDALDCVGNTAGTAIPGGFGWIKHDIGCSAQAIPLSWSDPGNSAPVGACSTELAAIQAGSVTLIPIYDTAGATGSNGWFHIVGFAAFKVTGYNFGGSDNWNNNGICTGNCRGIIGTFVKRVSLDEGYTTGGVDFGATSIAIVS
jgi:hypothetical protein